MQTYARPMRSLLRAASVCVTLAFTLETAAQSGALTGNKSESSLVVERAPQAADCLDAAGLAGRVNQLAGRTALVAAASASSASAFEVQILKSDEGYTAIVLAAGKSRQISDPGPTCESLSEAVALTLAILVDADETPPPAPPPPPPPAPVVTVAPPPVAAPLPAVPADPRWLLTAMGGVSGGLQDAAAPAVAVGTEVRIRGPLSILAGFSWMGAQSFALGNGHVDVQLLSGQVGPCVSTWRLLGGWHAGGCLQLALGGIHGQSVGYSETKEATRPWAAGALTGLLDVPVWGPLLWSSRVSAFGVITQEAFSIDGVGVAFDPPPVGILVMTGVGLKIL